MSPDIITGDYVIVQEGQVDLPKIVMLEPVTITDALTVNYVLPIILSDSMVIQDFASSEIPVILSRAIEVSDTVVVREGQTDSFTIEVNDSVTIAEFINTGTLLVELVGVTDFLSIFITSPSVHFPSVFDAITIQDSVNAVVWTIYIDLSDTVIVGDADPKPEPFDTVTIAESITIVPNPLRVNVLDAVFLLDAGTVFVVVVSIALSEELLVNEAVTVFQRNLGLTPSDLATITEDVVITVSSINLSLDVSDNITIVDVLEIQPNPMQILEFTEVISSDISNVLVSVIKAEVNESITVADGLDIRLSFLNASTQDSVQLQDIGICRIGKAKKRKRDLLIIGTGE